MSSQQKVYLARGGRHGQDEEAALEQDLSIVGFKEVPSLEGAESYEDVFELVASANEGAKTRKIGNLAGQLWAFAIAMEEGDLVVMPRKGTSQIAIGRVVGPYRFQLVGGEMRHTRPVEWVRPDVPRTAFEQDLLYSFGAFMTVCNITRNDAERRVAVVMGGKGDPGPSVSIKAATSGGANSTPAAGDEPPDLGQVAHDQIVATIQARFAGHALAALVNAVLNADGWVTKVSPPGPDGGVDILGGRGPLGLDHPRLCVQVKSQPTPADVTTYRTLLGTMQTFKADQGLLVCWGGFNKVVHAESKQGHFAIRFWDSGDLVGAVYRTYDSLPAEIQADLPLKQVWVLVPEDAGE